jgi:hypothetical protein
MANNKYEDSVSNSLKKGEIIHTNHKLEFLRFFKSHKRLCDEISGLKHHKISNLDNKLILIDRVTFIYAVRKLNSFIIDYLHYVGESVKRDHVMSEFYKLESDFDGDGEYQGFVKKWDNLSVGKNILFNKKYIYYLKRTFDVSYLMSQYLQNSLNIASREIVKNIQFVDYDGFFNNLSVYREEVANDLSNLKFETLYSNYKKLMGYFYTYRYLINKREQNHILGLLNLIYDYIILDNVVKYIILVNTGGSDISPSKVKDMCMELIIIRNSFNKIYFLCNFSLSLKNILPKSKKEVLVDNTLI